MPPSIEEPGDVPIPPPWSDPDPARPVPLWAGLRGDARAHIPPERRGRSRWGRALQAAGVALGSSGFRAVAAYRLAHAARPRGGPAGRVAAALLFWWVRHAYGCAIAPTARLHPGLILPHPQGIVVGPGAVVGPRSWIFQNVTVGGAPGKAGLPRVGSDARLYAGAVLSGPITLGDNVMVGANAVVSRDVPDRTVVRTAPPELAPLPEPFRSQGI